MTTTNQKPNFEKQFDQITDFFLKAIQQTELYFAESEGTQKDYRNFFPDERHDTARKFAEILKQEGFELTHEFRMAFEKEFPTSPVINMVYRLMYGRLPYEPEFIKDELHKLKGRFITIVTVSEMGYVEWHKSRIEDVEIKDYAQYSNCLHIQRTVKTNERWVSDYKVLTPVSSDVLIYDREIDMDMNLITNSIRKGKDSYIVYESKSFDGKRLDGIVKALGEPFLRF